MSIVDRRTKLKARRVIRKQRRLAEAATEHADESIEKLFFKRMTRLKSVRRFVFVWTVLLLFLGFGVMWQRTNIDQFYLKNAPTAGGIYREGVLGSFTTSNPLFAVSSVDASVSRLLYSGLFKTSPRGEVEGDLATQAEVDEAGTLYTVTLRTDVYWHDGEKFDAEDVVFTYRTIQNAEARSPLRSSWRDVRVEAVDDETVTFTLSNPLSSFQYSLTNGIVPEHLLGTEDPNNLRSSSFNTISPVGTGPFQLKTLQVTGEIDDRQESIALTRNDGYFGMRPGLDGVIIQSYQDEENMQKDFEEQVIQSMVGLTSVSDTVTSNEDVSLQEAALTSAVMIFLNNSSEILSDKEVRQALVHATDTDSIRAGLGYGTVAVDSPFLISQFPYNPEHTQLDYDIEKAKMLLDEAGWVAGADGIREKDGKQFVIQFVSQSLSEYATIAQKLQSEWGDIGVKVNALLQPEEDIQKSALANHDYDVLLYGISIGYDPDVFAYWHSTQANPNSANLNLSEYKRGVSDDALEAGRTRLDEELRSVKYQPFLKAWVEDAPAIALYQPRFLMVTRGTFEGFQSGQLSSATDRYYSIGSWKVRNAQVVR